MSRVASMLSCFPALCYSSKDDVIRTRTGSLNDTVHENPRTYNKELSVEEQKCLVVAAKNIPVHINYKDTIKFIPPITEGFVVKVYDGDTITIAARLPYELSPLYRFQVRLNGIDSPEIKGSNEDEKLAALHSKNEMIHLVMNKTVQLKNVGTEKYGRILADVYVGGLHVNQWMIDNNFAVPYGGGTKHCPESWIKYQEREHDSHSEEPLEF